MKHSLLLGLAAVSLCWAPAMAQQSERAPQTEAGTPDEVSVVSNGFTGAASAQPAALNLRAGAVHTGLSGYYDYQSNGMTRGRIFVEKGGANRVHVAYMRANDGTDSATVASTRRVGYALSTDGGSTWQSKPEIEQGFRLGFPYVAATVDGQPYIAAHGDPDGNGTRTMMYTGTSGGTTFSRGGIFERTSFTGRAGDGGAGVIWPAMVISPSDASKQVVVATLSPATQPVRDDEDPVHVSYSNLGGQGPWDIIYDQPIATSSGGRNVLAVSNAGKIGLAYYHAAGNVGGTSGTYYSESTDGGKKWSTPVLAVPAVIPIDDVDTMHTGGNLDLVFNGETPMITVTGDVNFLYARQGIYLWTPSSNTPMRIAGADSTLGIGLINAVATKAQPNMAYVSYPTISAGDDGQHIVVVFQAAAQTSAVANDRFESEDGFAYFRLWAVGSADGGATWNTPRIIQDFVGDGTDTASIEYPAAAASGKVTANSFEHQMVFQARSKPGMYAFIVADVSTDDGDQPADRGPFSETHMYFQKTVLDPTLFGQPASVKTTETAVGAVKILRSFPNPVSGALTVQYEVPTNGDVTLKVYDMLGAEVMNVAADLGYAGGYNRSLDVSALPAGQYRLVVSQNGRMASESFNVVR